MMKDLHSSSIGKVMLGAMPPGELAAWLRATELKKITDRTIAFASRLKADLAASRTRGFYATDGENVRDVMAVAAPLRMGTSTLGVAAAGPRQRMAGKEAAVGKELGALPEGHGSGRSVGR